MNNEEVSTTDNELHDQIKVSHEEFYSKPHQRPVHDHDGWEGHWAGLGSGMDDLADYNQNEGGDY